jgi:predicted nucleic acid-binding protein
VRRQVILDTGPLVALLDARDRHHRWTVSQWEAVEPPLLTCEGVVSEACFLLDQTGSGPAAVFEMLRRGAIALAFQLSDNVPEVQRLLVKYADAPMSVADASLVRMSEQFGRSPIMTLDGDFQLYRKHGRSVIPLIVPAELKR